MVTVGIPGFGTVCLEHLVLDMNGTLAVDGTLVEGIAARLQALAGPLRVHVVTADTFGTAGRLFAGLPVSLTVLCGPDEAGEKEAFVASLGSERTAAIGNGRNDAAMLSRASVGVAVLGSEGCAAAAASAADILVRDINDGLDLFLRPLRLKATLRA